MKKNDSKEFGGSGELRNLRVLVDSAPADGRPIIIAGPCSAESEEQLMDCGHQLARCSGVHIFRAGLWKPRTHPGGFEGVGERGIPWLQHVKCSTGLPTATEVATAAHVEAALDGGIDVLWLGARTTANPFAVQDVADAIAARHANVAVLVKNPVSPDVELWYGALQRIYRAGVRRLAAVHRGFATASNTPYRNAPLWQIPIELKRRCPGLPILVDPSHIGGQRDMVASLSQQALDMGFDGLMIECHPTPDSALSDSAQQITPSTLMQMLSQLSIRGTSDSNRELAALRQLIDQCDDELLQALSRRMDVVRQIGQLKRQMGMPIVQTDRFGQILDKRIAQAEEFGLRPDFINSIFQTVHQEAVALQL